MEIKIFENNNVKIIVRDEEPLFELYSTGKALGYSRWDGKTYNEFGEQKTYAYKSRIDKVISNAEITPVIIDNEKYLTESQLYDFLLEARTDSCKPFRRWVCDEVLPSIRKNKCYITESATQEEINFETLYGVRRIYDTFFNSTDVLAEYDRFYQMSKEKRANNHHAFNNQDRIKLSKKIIEALENKSRFAIASKEPISKIMSYQELLTKVQTDITELSNRYNGGIKAQQARKITQLELEKQNLITELNDTKEKIIQQQSCDIPFLEIPYRGFSTNKMYEPKLGRFKRTKEYNFWENNFPKYLFKNKSFSEHIDYNKPICVEMYFLTNGRFDVDNFSKPLLDVLSRTLEVNDKIFTKTICCECNEKVEDHYKDGKIYVRMYNYDPSIETTK
jgi:prophage antirepressor-like protein